MAVTADIAAREVAQAALAVEKAYQNEKAAVLKLDQGKVPVWRGVISYFPRALRAVAKVSDFGAKKYAWGAWAKVETPDRMERYADALHRHLFAVAERGYDALDPETNEPELAHAAWNALALLELVQRDKAKPQPAAMHYTAPVNGWDVVNGTPPPRP